MTIKVCKEKFERRAINFIKALWFTWNLSVIPCVILVGIIFTTDLTFGKDINTILVTNTILGGVFLLAFGITFGSVFSEIIKTYFEWDEDC